MTALPPPRSDFRSDTVTKPTAVMRTAMAEAEVGDDVLDGDPTVARLEQAGAEWLGKDGALFVPSGTMANQVAIGVWSRRGDELVALRDAHVLLYEAGAVGRLHGLQSVTLEGHRGAMDPADLRGAIRPPFIHMPRTAVVCVEQTHMSSGGRVVPLEALRAVREVAAETDVPVHLDGARLANAVVASGIEARDWAACADSVSVCLSKGLGAPVGSLVAGSASFLEEARVVRKRLGGWMRQSGVLAAAGLLALDEGLARLSEDHALATELAAILDARPGLEAPPAEVETNLVEVRVHGFELGGRPVDAPALAARLGEHGVGVLALRADVLRFVCHRDVGPEDLRRLSDALDAIVSA